MTTYTEEERKTLDMILDVVLESLPMICSTDFNNHDDDDENIELVYNHMKQVYEQETDVQFWRNEEYRKLMKEHLLNFVSHYLTLKFLDELEVGQNYEFGFMNECFIKEIVRDEKTNKVIKFLSTYEEDEQENTYDDIYKYFKHELESNRTKNFPELSFTLTDVKSIPEEEQPTEQESIIMKLTDIKNMILESERYDDVVSSIDELIEELSR